MTVNSPWSVGRGNWTYRDRSNWDCDAVKLMWRATVASLVRFSTQGKGRSDLDVNKSLICKARCIDPSKQRKQLLVNKATQSRTPTDPVCGYCIKMMIIISVSIIITHCVDEQEKEAPSSFFFSQEINQSILNSKWTHQSLARYTAWPLWQSRRRKGVGRFAIGAVTDRIESTTNSCFFISVNVNVNALIIETEDFSVRKRN